MSDQNGKKTLKQMCLNKLILQIDRHEPIVD